MSKKIMVALGGNAIQTKNGATASEQQEACFNTGKHIVNLITAGWDVILSHGNGPQVGNILLQQTAMNSRELPAMPLDTCGAMSQGMIGYWLQNALDELLNEAGIKKRAVTIVSQTVVSSSDSAFSNPTKPIGSFYNKEEMETLRSQKGYKFVEDAGRGYRRVVASPAPIDIVEKLAVQKLLESGFVVIAGGGGGIPVCKKGSGYEGIEAVIDKDLASMKLAELLNVDCFLILTAVDHVAINFGQPNQEQLKGVTVSAMKQYINEGHFAPGSMLPKVQAAVSFVEANPNKVAIITSLTKATEAIAGKMGTKIISG